MILVFYCYTCPAPGAGILFLTCPAVPCPYLGKVRRKKIPQRGEDDFLPADPSGA